ncbi:MAG: hypothetical protein FCKEOINB_00883 [Nitrosomonas sp.]|nr:hypothetical protein [Nitrosomonas sp.]
MLKDYQEDVEQILNEFFVLTDDGWINQRAFDEIQSYIFQEENNQLREDGEKNRIRRHREERKKLFADLREAGVVPKWDILMGPLRELHKQHCNKTKTGNVDTCNAPVTEQERACNAPAMAITNNQEPLTNNHKPEDITHTVYPSQQSREPTPAASVCLELKKIGIIDLNPAHPKLLMLIEAGATIDEFMHAARTAKDKGKGFAYVLGIVKSQRAEAAQAKGKVLQGTIPKQKKWKKFSGFDYVNGGDGYGNKREQCDDDSRTIEGHLVNDIP